MQGVRKHLIVARHLEDTSWVDLIDGWEPLVVTKGQDMPNEGREASSYFWAIHRLYPHLEPDSQVACLQGHPFDHCADLVEQLAQPAGSFRALGWWDVKCGPDGAPHHPGLDLDPCYRRWVGGTPPTVYEFVAGAQFVVPGRLILRRPDNYWRNMVKRMTGNGPWVMERLWPYLFAEDE